MSFFDRFKNSSKPKKFKYLDKLIHSGVKEIILDSDIVLGGREEKKYLKGIKLDVDDLIIDGNGHTIDACGKTRIFYCTGKNVIIKNIILKNGFGKHYGGAILNEKGKVTITESTLSGNTVQGKNRGGGAIYNDEGEFTIISSTLSGNTAKNVGGAIYNWEGKLTITESTLKGNTAEEDGGAIKNGWDGELTITKSTFEGNTANRGGGAISNFKGDLTITSSTLNNNTAKGNGGAIKNGGSLNINGCKILSNRSPNNIIFTWSFMEVYNTKFNDNQSEHVLVNEYDKFNISIIDSEFIGNNVEKDVIFNNGKSGTIQNTIFENNLSRNITNKTDLTLISTKIKDDRQSILNDGHILIKQSPNLESKIYGEGTVETDAIPEEAFDFGYLDKKIHESKTKEIILDHDITFENYEIDFYEGGIELDMDDLVIDGNGHTIDGANKSRIFTVTGKNITLKNMTFKNGVTHENYHYHFNISGGAVRINYDAKITIENCKFITNIAKDNGGAIYNSNGELTLTNSTFEGNTAKNNGGAICNAGKLTIMDSAINHNTAQESGGAIYNSGDELTITESTLNYNIAKGENVGGGAIRNHRGELTITKSTLSNNSVEVYSGGAISNSGELTIIDSTLARNITQIDKSVIDFMGYGGAIINDGVTTITESTLTGNRAWHGGAICNHRGELTITKSILNNNFVKGCGGAIENNEGELTIIDSTLNNNTARLDGGAIENWEGKLTITESTLKGNITHIWGGAIHNKTGELTITSSTLSGNTAKRDGGAIRKHGGDLTITSSTLSGNTAKNVGGAIFNMYGELTITESTLNNNTARLGGAIYLKDSKYESENCTFKDNEPDDVYERKD